MRIIAKYSSVVTVAVIAFFGFAQTALASKLSPPTASYRKAFSPTVKPTKANNRISSAAESPSNTDAYENLILSDQPGDF
jgi:hypothetical protein